MIESARIAGKAEAYGEVAKELSGLLRKCSFVDAVLRSEDGGNESVNQLNVHYISRLRLQVRTAIYEAEAKRLPVSERLCKLGEGLATFAGSGDASLYGEVLRFVGVHLRALFSTPGAAPILPSLLAMVVEMAYWRENIDKRYRQDVENFFGGGDREITGEYIQRDKDSVDKFYQRQAEAMASAKKDFI